MKRLAAALLILAALTVAGCGANSTKASAPRVAGEYVKTLAHAQGVTIIGDKVWRVLRYGPVTVVVVRIRWTSPFASGIVTFFVREINGSVLGASQ